MCKFLLFLVLTLQAYAEIPPQFKLSWPTPNPAFARGLGYSTFLQKTGPDKAITSGAFGCVRNNGYKFHEGLDLYPVRRDKKGRAEDSIFAAMDGRVSYLNPTASYSAYGKYIVLEHTELTPALYSLYAHLDTISTNLKIGSEVSIAQVIGKMGNSSSGYRIPLERSHLHFEIGLRLTNQFQGWYNRKKFQSKNRHGNFSGFNLVGLDPMLFYSNYKKKIFTTPKAFLESLPVTVKVRVKTNKTPDFAIRYPSLASPRITSGSNGWDVSFGPYGIPIRLEPVNKNISSQEKQIQIIQIDSNLQKKPCRKLTTQKGSQFFATPQLQTYIELLFGI
ncbi:MAG: M23 family metallopeptidase [Opitutales bacterium]|nr:M23 family metallopeptidase [Opitutales bacterium]MDG1326654.1 M23 family metallopeptidase [Opitutales bacterium]